MLQSMGSHRVGRDLETEQLNDCYIKKKKKNLAYKKMGLR